jgi:hypothetical protein
MRGPNNPFGVLTFLHWNHDWNNYHFQGGVLDKALDLLQELGVSMIRQDILWSDIHRGHLQYDFSKYDELISKISGRGLQVLGVLQYNKVDLREGKEVWSTPPESFEEFSAYVGAVVDQYKSKIKHWEIWNEPNLSVYWSGPQDDLKSYSRLLKLSYEAAKKADPTCSVLHGGLAEPIVEGVIHLYQQKAPFDILNIHPFLNPHDPKSSERLHRIMTGVCEEMKKQNEEEKKIWITEMGCPGLPSDKMNLTWFGGDPVDEHKQADWLEKQYEWIQKYPTVEKLFWAFYRDTENEFKDATDYMGLVRLDLTPKPAYSKMKALIQRYRG